ncbi:MAG TPA: metallophosphoesterase [Solirubrobacteraceae bacterium]|nr:metallophosphoesterase [Solirubrobacteraceae bacterium]
MRTLIVSDLHLGGLSGIDLLRRPGLRASLLAELQDVDRLVLLGDVLELRHGPPHEALAAARPFFEDVGRALGEGELIVTAGNHDHLLVSTWLDARALHAPGPLRLEHRIAAAEASPMLAQIAEWTRPARVQGAYPGLWVRPDVYAMHGHYLDCHLTIPTLERLGVGAIGRLLERPPSALDTVEGYEAVTSPIYAWRDVMARYARTGPALNGVATVRAWHALGGGRGVDEDGLHGGAGTGAMEAGGGVNGAHAANAHGGGDASSRNGRAGIVRAAGSSLGRRALKSGFPLMVSALNRAGLGPVSADISRGELRRGGLRAMGEVAARLDLGDAYVVFGHTHRAGPFPGDVESEWRGRSGARLVNSGCWTYDSIFLTAKPGESPYWPGTCVLVEDSGPPVLKRLLLNHSYAELEPQPA